MLVTLAVSYLLIGIFPLALCLYNYRYYAKYTIIYKIIPFDNRIIVKRYENILNLYLLNNFKFGTPKIVHDKMS